jgi:hypothetical protein
MNEKLVTVARFSDYIQADLARQLLEDEGIQSFVMGQNVGNVYSGVPVAVDIELQTPASKAEEARQILEASEREKQELAEDEDLELDEGVGDEQDLDQDDERE